VTAPTRLAPIALLLVLPLLLAGCMGATGVPLPVDRMTALRHQFEELDLLEEEAIKERIAALRADIAGAEGTRDRALRADVHRKQVLLGYCWERLGAFSDAQTHYAQAASGEYGSVALFRSAQVAEHLAARAHEQMGDPNVLPEERQAAAEHYKLQRERAVKALERAANYPVDSRVLLREPPVASVSPGLWRVADLRREAHQRLDVYYQERLIYRVFDFLVSVAGGRERRASYLLAIIALAVAAKLITTPLSAAQFRSMRAMQAVQPEVRKLQEKYKDDKQALARAQMELFKKHGVNPASSCLPLLVQMPILIWVYYGIRYYIYRFQGISFLHIQSLADPDVITVGGMQWPGPLLLLYGVSMYFSQKLLATPAATPEQQQQQKLMTYMMPVLLVIILRHLPAAFILYWLLQNFLMTGHQYLLLRPERTKQAAAAGVAEAPPAPPPPEAIQKLSQASQGTRPRKKKAKRK